VTLNSVVAKGSNENKIGGFEGSQAVPDSPSGRGDAVCGICSILIFFQELGATVMG
jgi:hypothetical protein